MQKNLDYKIMKKLIEFANFDNDTKQISLKDIYDIAPHINMENELEIINKLEEEFKNKIVQFKTSLEDNIEDSDIIKDKILEINFSVSAEPRTINDELYLIRHSILYFLTKSSGWRSVLEDYPITVFLIESEADKFGL